MNILNAPMRITQGEAFSWEATVVGQDWTGYTGTVTFRANDRQQLWQSGFDLYYSEPDPILVATVTGNAAGKISFALTPAQTDTFPALERMGWLARAKAQIRMSNGVDVQTYQVRVSVAKSFG